MAYERLVRKLTHENLWIYILTLLKDGPLYGYEVRRMIEERFGFKPGQVTSYIVLYRLEKDGYIKIVGEAKGSRGPLRRYYAITRRGSDALRRARLFLSSILDKMG